MNYALFTLRAELAKLTDWLDWLRNGDQWQRQKDRLDQIAILEQQILDLNEGILYLEKCP